MKLEDGTSEPEPLEAPEFKIEPRTYDVLENSALSVNLAITVNFILKNTLNK